MNQRKEIKKSSGVFFIRLAGVLLCLVLLLTCLLSGILARYTHNSPVDDPARVIKFEKLTVNDNTNVFTDPDTHTMLLAPGITIHRNTSVTFGGSEAACYVFLRVHTTEFTKSGNYDFNYGTVSGKTITFAVDDSWTFLKTDNGDSVYYTVTDPNEALSAKPVLEDGSIYVGSDFTRTEMEALPIATMQIAFDSYAVQLDGFGDYATEAEHAAAAWDSVKTHNVNI